MKSKVQTVLLCALFCLSAIALPNPIKAQTIIDLSYPPNAGQFVANASPLLFRDIYVIGDNKLALKVIILTDFDSHKKIGYVTYTSQDAAGNAVKVTSAALGSYIGETSRYTSSLDYDELKYCIQCIEYAKESLMGGRSDSDYISLFYTTKLGGKFGVRSDQTLAPAHDPTDYISVLHSVPKWEAFFNADPLEYEEFEQTFPLGGKNTEKILVAFKAAKQLIETKTGLPVEESEEGIPIEELELTVKELD